MAPRKGSIPDFSGLVIEDAPAPPAISREPDPKQPASTPRRRQTPGKTGGVKENASSVLLYLNPAGHKALKLYAVEADVRVHDLLLEAVEDWARRKGIKESMRFNSKP